MSSYPHMSPRESVIWEDFLRSRYMPKGNVYYDSRVGHAIPAEPGASAWLSAVRNVTSRKRLDVVIETRDAWWLVEVKVRAGLSAIGQVIGYTYLFGQSLSGERPILGLIVCNYAAMDIDTIAEQEGIGLYVASLGGPPRWVAPQAGLLFGFG